MGFEIEHEHFKGPFELLLNLIEERKLLVNEISLSKVTDDLIQYLQQQEKFPMGESAHFILVAATLILIKSKSLLPTLELTTEEQGDIKSLELRLRMYRRISEAGATIQARFGKQIAFAPAKRDFMETVFSPGKIKKTSISEAIRRVLMTLPKIESLPKVIVQKVISLEEMIGRLTTRVQNGIKMNFKDFAGSKEEKVNVIVGFLAMLELVKRGLIEVEQQNTFSDIEMQTRDIGIPKYT